jgi:hypothetical protein
MPANRLLDQVARTFTAGPYIHRNSQIGNRIADCLFEDLYALRESDSLVRRIDDRSRVLNPKGLSPGIRTRRGDGSFGDAVPGSETRTVEGFAVGRGSTADIEIGVEVKILAKAMIKQIDRLTSDLCGQARHFREKSDQAIRIGIVAINQAPRYVSFEGNRAFPTDGRRYVHPVQEAAEAERRLLDDARPSFDEFLILPFVATNEPPFSFSWVHESRMREEYAAALLRVSRLYDRRFPPR